MTECIFCVLFLLSFTVIYKTKLQEGAVKDWDRKRRNFSSFLPQGIVALSNDLSKIVFSQSICSK